VRVYQFRHIRAVAIVAAGSLALVIVEGQPAPDFELLSDAGELVRLSDLRGRPVVLYFYPKDDT
jgi:cytochrome oxidase Cu insertion factor (SCO1/SenC/PrrC family)